MVNFNPQSRRLALTLKCSGPPENDLEIVIDTYLGNVLTIVPKDDEDLKPLVLHRIAQ